MDYWLYYYIKVYIFHNLKVLESLESSLQCHLWTPNSSRNRWLCGDRCFLARDSSGKLTSQFWDMKMFKIVVSMDWFKGNLNRKPWFLLSNIGVWIIWKNIIRSYKISMLKSTSPQITVQHLLWFTQQTMIIVNVSYWVCKRKQLIGGLSHDFVWTIQAGAGYLPQ